jgi:hypothetical protein
MIPEPHEHTFTLGHDRGALLEFCRLISLPATLPETLPETGSDADDDADDDETSVALTSASRRRVARERNANGRFAMREGVTRDAATPAVAAAHIGFRITAAARLPRLRSLADPLVASNFLFALCSALYALSAHWVQAALVLVSCVASCAYHRSRESRYVLLDRYGAATAFFGTLGPLVALRSAPVNAAIALDCVVAFSFYFRCGTDRESPVYSRNHSMWHASIFVGQMIVACALL